MKPKILFLLHLAPPVHGAAVAGGYVKNSAIINESLDGMYVNLATASSLSDIGKSGFKKVLLIVNLYYKIFLALKNNPFQLCYITINAKGPAWFKELAIVAIVKLFNVPIIYHFHNKGVAENGTGFIKKQLYRFQFKHTQTILISPLLYKDIQAFVKESKVHYCFNGMPINVPTIDGPAKKNENDLVKILFLSNLIESKGVYVLLAACAILKQKQIPFGCVFVGGEGDISAQQFNEKVQQFNLQDCVDYQGIKYGVEKEAAFAEADIFAFPTYYHNECFGLVNLEAMQQAIPIISTFEGAIPQVVIDGITGYLVPQKNADALADKLAILIAQPSLRKEMGLAGKKHFEENFTLDTFENKMVEILKLASSKG